MKYFINILLALLCASAVSAKEIGETTFMPGTASRLLATDASKNLESVSNLCNWVYGTALQIVCTDNLDGTLTLDFPDAVAITTSLTLPLIQGAGGTGNNLTLNSNSANDGLIILGDSVTGLVFDEDDYSATIGGGEIIHTINGSNAKSLFEFHQDGNTAPGGVSFHRHTNTASTSSDIYFLRSRGDHATPLIVQDGDELGHIIATGYDGTDDARSASIQFDVDGTPGADDMPGRIVFQTSADGAQTLTERARIDSSGNFNIAGLTASRLVFTDASKNLESATSDITNAELETLTDTSNADALHVHASAGISGIDHGSDLDATSLTHDDHTQYFLLAGRSGGTVAYGGTGASDTYELHTTSHATKGVGNLGDTLYVDEVNNRVGISDATPEALLDVGGGTATSIDGTDDLLVKDDVEIDGDLYIEGSLKNIPFYKNYFATTQGLGANPDVYAAGYYQYSAADANLTEASTTQVYGTANVSYAAHAFVVAAAAGVTDGSDLVLTVSGVSITDAGVRNAADSEVVVADCTAAALNGYYETSKKWLGQITYTLSSTAGTAFNFDFNYGFDKYDDFGNRDFTITDFEAVGLAGANDTNFSVKLLYHRATGWAYSAAAFTPVTAANTIVSLVTDHATDDQLVASQPFAYKRAGLSQAVTGSGSEGFLILIESSANNALEYGNFHVGVQF